MDKKIVILGTFPESKKIGRYYSSLTVRAEIEIAPGQQDADKVRLSISGDVGFSGARDVESCGQIQDEVRQLLNTPRAILNHPKEKIARLLDIWERWHLNDMRAGCEHQRASWDPLEKIQLVTYHLKTDTLREQDTIRRNWQRRITAGETVLATEDELRIVKLPYEVKAGQDQPAPGPAYAETSREVKTAGWVYPKEHPRGLLCKPCPTCGYKYGSAWLYEPLPADVVKFLEDF
jgi:hypothetical protein